MRPQIKAALLVLILFPSDGMAQGIRRVTAGAGVDTTSASSWSDLSWRGSVPEIYRSWREYLVAGRGTPDAAPYWVSAERLGLPLYDLTTVVAPNEEGLSATVLDIRPAHVGATDEFVVKTLIGRVTGQDIQPVAVLRVFAAKENDRWVFANALPRLTAHWLRADVGQISYVITPEGLFERTRAEDLVSFADSVAARFEVPRLPSLIYYFANDAEELHRAMGVDWTYGRGTVGYALWQDHMLLSGSAGFADSNRHEIVHILLAPLEAEGRTHPIVREGVATWLGGAEGVSFDGMMREYANYLRGNPSITADRALAGPADDKGWYPTGAALVLLVYEKGGFPLVKELYATGTSNDELETAMSRMLRMTWPQISARVRSRILELSEAN